MVDQVTRGRAAVGRGRVRLVATAVGVLLLVIVVFAAIRVLQDVPHITAGTVPEDPYAVRYVQHPVLAYVHIGAGLVYLLGALLQLSARFRDRHLTVHRRLGRVLVTAGLVSGVFALAFGIPHSFGGAAEAVATVVFGLWFLACLLLALRAIRSGDVVAHRRWMIRAFATGVAVGTIRLWVGLFQATDLLDLRDSLGPAFWLAFTMHVALGEVWVRTTPHPPTRARRR